MSGVVCRSVVASEGLGVWGALWIQVMGDLLLPLMADLARFVSTRARDFPGESPIPDMLCQYSNPVSRDMVV